MHSRTVYSITHAPTSAPNNSTTIKNSTVLWAYMITTKQTFLGTAVDRVSMHVFEIKLCFKPNPHSTTNHTTFDPANLEPLPILSFTSMSYLALGSNGNEKKNA